jgi:hypothetical protein
VYQLTGHTSLQGGAPNHGGGPNSSLPLRGLQLEYAKYSASENEFASISLLSRKRDNK